MRGAIREGMGKTSLSTEGRIWSFGCSYRKSMPKDGDPKTSTRVLMLLLYGPVSHKRAAARYFF